jgi:hypothetical protein
MEDRPIVREGKLSRAVQRKLVSLAPAASQRPEFESCGIGRYHHDTGKDDQASFEYHMYLAYVIHLYRKFD